MEEKIPCIRCNSQLWNYVKPYLKEWGYNFNNISFNDDSKDYPLLVINFNGRLGRCYTLPLYYKDGYNRILMTDVEGFLERAATLKGFTYKKPVLVNGIEIKPGMVIETVDSIRNSKSFWIVFPTKKGLAITRWGYSSWEFINEFVKYHSKDIENIYDCINGESLTSGDVLWGKSKEIVITMDKIAEKFGYPVDCIKIMK